MEFKRIPTQLELFSEKEQGRIFDGESRPPRRNISIRQYERYITLFICFIIFGIFSFSLGFERGRRLADNTQRGNVNTAPAGLNKKNVEPKIPRRKIKKDKKDKKSRFVRSGKEKTSSSGSGIYTIQIASYLKEKYAKLAAQKFQKQGYHTIVMPKGKYIILCIGSFSSKEKALNSLKKIKKDKNYRDSFIRRL